MRTLKFVSRDRAEEQFAIEVRENVSNYFKEKGISSKGNLTMVIQTFTMLCIYVLPFILLLTVRMNIWAALLMVIFMGIGMAGVGMCVMHDGVHGSYSEKRWLNKISGNSMYLLGSNVFNWKIQHNILHHAYTNIEGYDQDIESRGPIRLSENAPLRRIHHYQNLHAFFFYGLMTISKLTKDFTQLAEFNIEGITRQHHVNPAFEYIKMIFLKLLYLTVILGLPFIFTVFSWWQILLGFAIVHWTAGIILSAIFQMAHVVEGTAQPMPDADGVIATGWAVHQLNTTSDFARGNVFLNWYAGGLNYQIEHHLFPNICHIHYSKIAPIVEKAAKQFGFNYNLKPSFFAALSSHVKRLKELTKPLSVKLT